MSGDVQPRKRKDKRRKKEGGSLGDIHDTTSTHKFKSEPSKKSFDLNDLGEKIHIQNEHGIGGNICVKIVFFCLLALLVGAVGLIYVHSQGSTDVDLPSVEESRFSEYFTGWLDDAVDDHEHETAEHADDGDDHEHNEEDVISSFFNFGAKEEPEKEEEPDIIEEKFMESEQQPAESEEEAQEDEDGNDGKYKDNEDDNELGDVPIKKRKLLASDEEDDDDGDDNDNDNDNDDDDDDENENEEGDEEKEEEEYDASQEDDSGDIEENNRKRKYKFFGKKFIRNFRNIHIDDDDDDDEDEDVSKEQLNTSGGEEEEINKHVTYEDDKKASKLSRIIKLKNTKNVDKKEVFRLKPIVDDSGYDEIDESDVEDDKYENEGEDEDEDEDEDEGEGEDESLENQKEENESENENEFDSIDDNEKSETDGDDDDDDDIVEEMPVVSKIKYLIESINIRDLINQLSTGAEVEEDTRRKGDAKEEKGANEETGGDDETADQISYSVVVTLKVGVGIALIIVAHLVLVQKWKAKGNVPPDESGECEGENLSTEQEPVISRRQTLVPEDVSLNDGLDEEDMEEEPESDEEVDENYEKEECSENEEGEGEEEDDDDDDYQEEGQVFRMQLGDKWRTLQNNNTNIKEKHSDKVNFLENEDEEDEEVQNEDDFEHVDDVENEEDYDDENCEEEEELEDEEEDVEEGHYEEDDVEEEEPEEDYFKSKNFSPREDAAPIPPPRSHKRSGQSEEEELEGQSEEVVVEEKTSFRGDVVKQEQEELNSAEVKQTNADEWSFRQEFQYADEQFENNPKLALRTFEEILSKKPTLVRALVGRARVLDHIAEVERSNTYLKQATNAYMKLILQEGHRLDDEMFEKLSERCIQRMRFGGYLGAAIEIHKALVQRFPKTPKFRNTLAVTYLMSNYIEPARKVLKETLTLWPENGFALVHYGFILKTTDNNMEEGAKLLMKGINTKEEGVIDGMFFFHLGDALNRLGKPEKAIKWYDLGVEEGLFLSRYQRSLYNVNRLKGQPWWTKEETTYQNFFDRLEKNWREIRREGLELYNAKGVNLFKAESENLKNTGDWRQMDLFFRGRKQPNCDKAPVTCSLVSAFKPAARCTRGQIKFSVMLPNTHVWPHCGPTNCRLRSHLGLVVPPKTYIRVAEETRTWEEGKFIIFDDSFEHEVWHNGTSLRLVLIVDIWHPELTEHERQSLSPI
ncbi:hypothetical protein RUM43_012330 [Polyplax serrata]|uniref:Aspartyl/asparaginy/proline hydroxylase domain-containing protein n=1 Tax=Polyplax serrata TaxID=468196 RepID=A0AAN8RSV7_POLSC